MANDKTVAENLKRLRKQHGYTQQQLADILHTAKTTVSTWERGAAKPRMDVAKELANIYSISVSELIGDATETNSPEYINLDEALRKQGVVMEFQGKELSDKAKRKILDILKIVDGDED